MLIPSMALYAENKLIITEFVEVDAKLIASKILENSRGDFNQNKNGIIEKEPVLSTKTPNT